MSLLEKAKTAWRFRRAVRRANELATDDKKLAHAVTNQPFRPGDRVQHLFFGAVGTVERLGPMPSMPTMQGVFVVWDDFEVVDVEPGEPIWYPSMALNHHPRRHS